MFITNIHAAATTTPIQLLMLSGRNHVPTTVDAHTYRRACFLLSEHVGDFIIEWTDGSVVDPGDDLADPRDDLDTRTQWFGWGRDTNCDGNIAVGQDDVVSKTAWLQTYDSGDTLGLLSTFANNIEIERADNGFARYYAIWATQLNDPAYAPRALRILIRLYDSQMRLRDSRGHAGQFHYLYFDLPG